MITDREFMGFSSDTVERRFFNQAKERCEVCGKDLKFPNRGCSKPNAGWEAHHKKAVSIGGTDDIRNCRIICCACIKNHAGMFDNAPPNKTAAKKEPKKTTKIYYFGAVPEDGEF